MYIPAPFLHVLGTSLILIQILQLGGVITLALKNILR